MSGRSPYSEMRFTRESVVGPRDRIVEQGADEHDAGVAVVVRCFGDALKALVDLDRNLERPDDRATLGPEGATVDEAQSELLKRILVFGADPEALGKAVISHAQSCAPQRDKTHHTGGSQ